MKNERDEKEALGQVINNYIRDRLSSGHRQSANYAHSLITLGWQARAEYEKGDAEICECGHDEYDHHTGGNCAKCACMFFTHLPVQPAEDADEPGADAPVCESCGSTLIASDPHAVTDGEPLLCVKCVQQEISMGDTKHDPYCDCGICQYCGGDEDVYGNPTTAHKRPDIRAASVGPYQRVARELRRLFPIEIRYNCDFEAFVKRLEKGEL